MPKVFKNSFVMPNAETIGHEEVVVQPDFDSASLLQVILSSLIMFLKLDSDSEYKENRSIIRLNSRQSDKAVKRKPTTHKTLPILPTYLLRPFVTIQQQNLPPYIKRK